MAVAKCRAEKMELTNVQLRQGGAPTFEDNSFNPVLFPRVPGYPTCGETRRHFSADAPSQLNKTSEQTGCTGRLFSPPFVEEMGSRYEEVNLETVESMACFTCGKGE